MSHITGKAFDLKLLTIPVLYISRHIIQSRFDYYRLLQHTRHTHDWEPWTLCMLEAVEMIKRIKRLMPDYKKRIRDEQPRMNNQDLINSIFRHPYKNSLSD